MTEASATGGHKISSLLINMALVMAWGTAVSFASLGDNELKISQTYGNPTDEQKLSQSLMERHYCWEGMAITVVFLNGTSQCETFKKVDRAPLTDGQIGKILEANANRLAWTPEASVAQNTREWVIAGPKPALSEKSEDPAVFAVSGRTPPARGEKLIAVDMLDTDDDSSSVPSAPPVLRRAIYKSAGTNSVLKVFTSAYENVSRHELPQNDPLPVSDK